MSEVHSVRITFGIIARCRIPELERLAAHLLALVPEGEGEVVIALESPKASEPAEHPQGHVRWIDIPHRHGLGYNRNRVIDAARGDVLVWADDDCMPQPGWLESLLAALDDPSVAAVAGVLRIPPAGFVGDSISALGFPAGGNAGYATMFVVHEDGTTENLPSGNSAIRLSVLRELGGYDESMTHGGEDTELSHRLNVAGKRIMFAPDAILEHPARTSVGEFTRWSFRRGRAKRQFARRVAIGGYVGQRLGSFGKILKANAGSAKILLVVPLLVINLAWQWFGFVAESMRPTPPPPRTSDSALGRGFEQA